MNTPSNIHERVINIYYNEGHVKAWNYWRLLGNSHSILLGEIPSSEFITGTELCSAINLTEGNDLHTNTPWLKFILDGKIIVYPMKSIRNEISWNDIYNVGGVFEEQDSSVTIQDEFYNVTLIRGGNDDCMLRSGHNVSWTNKSEWNRLLYPIHDGENLSDVYAMNPNRVDTPYNVWASYDDYDLNVNNSNDNGFGSAVWCQDFADEGSRYRLMRGDDGLTYADYRSKGDDSRQLGFRPCLRLIEK